MLYVFHGTDTTAVVDRARACVADLTKEHLDAQVFLFDEPISEPAELDAHIDARDLFARVHITVLKDPFGNTESEEFFLSRTPRLQASENLFVIVAGKLTAGQRRTFETHAVHVEEQVRHEAKHKEYNVFALADALTMRDKRGLWVGYRGAIRAGLAPESICGTLHWAVRAMLAASRERTPEEAGLKPYPFEKARRGAARFSHDELSVLSQSLIRVYHDAHRGRHDLALALERWVIGL